jgi:hypothetical protein
LGEVQDVPFGAYLGKDNHWVFMLKGGDGGVEFDF